MRASHDHEAPGSNTSLSENERIASSKGDHNAGNLGVAKRRLAAVLRFALMIRLGTIRSGEEGWESGCRS